MNNQANKKQNFLFDEAAFLILEDIPSFRSQLILDLRNLNVKGPFYEASSISEAQNILQSFTVDFIIGDWNLPDGSGLDFLKEVRSQKRFDKTPFIVWTTKNEIPDIIDAITAGAGEYFCKPWTIEELSTKIKKTWIKLNGPI